MTTPFTAAVREAFAASIVVAEHPDDDGLRRRLSRQRVSGELAPLTRGIFVPTPAVEDLAPWEVEVLRTWAASALGRVRQPLCRASAARLWGVPMLEGQVASGIHALGWSADATRTRGDIRYWANSDAEAHVVTLEGARLTDLPRTLAELAATSTFAGAVAAIDWGIRMRNQAAGPVTTVDEIRAVADALGFSRGRARLERALAFGDGRSESPGESWARVLMHELGFEMPELQHEYRLPDGRVFRTDFRWTSIGLAAEFDGLAKYRSAELRAGRSVEQVVIEEKEREDGVRSTGDGMLRLVWGDLRDRRRFAHRLEGAGVPRPRRRGISY
jgi:hypothetical protein